MELQFQLQKPVCFSIAMLQEHIESGQRIEAFALDAWTDTGWQEITRGTTVGYKRLLRFKPVEADKVRLRILESRASPTLAEFRLFLGP